MSGRPLLLVTVPVLTVLAICLYLRRRGRPDSDPPEPPPPEDAVSETEPVTPVEGQTAGRDLSQVTAWVRDNIETLPEPEVEPEPAVEVVSAAAMAKELRKMESADREEAAKKEATPEPAAVVGAGGDVIRELEAVIQPAQAEEQDGNDSRVSEGQQNTEVLTEALVAVEESLDVVKEVEEAKETPVLEEEAPVTSAQTSAVLAGALAASAATLVTAATAVASTRETSVEESQPAEAAREPEAASDLTAEPEATVTEAEPSASSPVEGAEASEPATGAAAEAAADTASENSSDSGKGGSSGSLEQGPSSGSPESAAMQTTVYDFLIPQKLCGRLIGKNGTFVNMLKARTGAHVIIRLHPAKSSVKICSVDGTQTEIDACLKLIREKFPINKFPAMTLEQLNKPTEQSLAVPDSQQLHLPQGVTCDVLVSAVVSAGQLFLQQHTHPTFRGLERLASLMSACYGDGNSTPELPRPVVASSICAAPVAGGWYRAQVVAFYPDSDELDVRFMDFGGYSRIPAGHARQIRTDFMSLPFQAEECYLANVMPTSEDGWSLEAGAVLESLITDRALEAMVVGYAEDGTPFVNLYSIQATEYGNSGVSLVNQRLVESGAARWVENQA